MVVAIGVVFTLARFSQAFLVLKAQAEGLALALIPLVFAWMNIVYALTATPAGILSDKIGRMKLLLCGLGALFIADLTLAFVPGLGGVFIGVGLWGSTWDSRRDCCPRSSPIPRLKTCGARPSAFLIL